MLESKLNFIERSIKNLRNKMIKKCANLVAKTLELLDLGVGVVEAHEAEPPELVDALLCTNRLSFTMSKDFIYFFF